MKFIFYNGNPSQERRKRLNELCNGEKFPFNHKTKYKSVFFPEFENVLSVVLPPDINRKYNCFAHALGVTEWVVSAIIAQAVRNNDLKPTENPRSGDIMIYCESSLDYIRHAGKFVSEQVVQSKWASGPVFEHETFMCPLRYGDKATYFKAIDRELVHKLVKKYKDFNKSSFQP